MSLRICALAVAAVLMVGAAGVTADAPSWYSCSCSRSGSTPCVCPSTDPPGRLNPSDIPQFVLFTHDDAITSDTLAAVKATATGKATKDGCPVAMTFFTTTSGNDCDITAKLYRGGNEIADHTVHHLDMNGMPKSQVEDEILGARRGIAACGVDAADIVGFRQPFLESNPTVREVLYENGFLYDSTILEWPTQSLSDGMGARVWPYTMGSGIPQNCAWFAPAQSCDKTERYPGLFEVPLWDLNAADGIFSMDYGDGSNAYDVLKANFDAAYAGNRAPMPVFIHTPWLTANADGMAQFVDYALSHDNVYFVTMRQLLAWMQNPVPASQITPKALGCGNTGGAPAGSVSTRSYGSPAGATALPPPAAQPTPSPAAEPVPPPAAEPVPSPAEGPAVGGAPAPEAGAPAEAPAPAPAAEPALAPADADADADTAPAPAPVAAPVSGAAGTACRVVVAAAAAALALMMAL